MISAPHRRARRPPAQRGRWGGRGPFLMSRLWQTYSAWLGSGLTVIVSVILTFALRRGWVGTVEDQGGLGCA